MINCCKAYKSDPVPVNVYLAYIQSIFSYFYIPIDMKQNARVAY